jgi:tetratricopeptide (TPR) repeat protein
MSDDAAKAPLAGSDPASPEDVRKVLAAIQSSASFSSSRQLSLFLGYVVEKTLAGEGERIKAYSIATEALGRPESFDPSVDPIVRVEAGRLRRALETYYQGEGAGERLRIAIPRGTYVPRFETVEEPAGASAEPREVPAPAPTRVATPVEAARRDRWQYWLGGMIALVALLVVGGFVSARFLGSVPVNPEPIAEATRQALKSGENPMAPRIFVQPFAIANEVATGVTGNQFAARLSTALARFDEVAVVTRPDGEADYIVSGTLSEGPAGVSAATLLSDQASGRVVWSQKLTAPRNPIQPSLAIDELIGDAAVAIAQPYGVVMADRFARSDKTGEGYGCLIRSFDYWRDLTSTAHVGIRGCLEDLTLHYPKFALAYAMLAFTYLDEDGLAFAVSPDSPAVEKAVKASASAVQLAPNSARAKQALQFSYFATGQTERAIETGEQAIALNPLDTDVRAGQGLILIAAGRYQEGARLIEASAAHNTAYPPWYDLYLALAAFQSGNEEATRRLIKRVDLPDNPLAALLGLIAGGADGSPEARQAALDVIEARVPDLIRAPNTVLRRILPNEALIAKLVAAGRAAGLPTEKAE